MVTGVSKSLLFISDTSALPRMRAIQPSWDSGSRVCFQASFPDQPPFRPMGWRLSPAPVMAFLGQWRALPWLHVLPPRGCASDSLCACSTALRFAGSSVILLGPSVIRSSVCVGGALSTEHRPLLPAPTWGTKPFSFVAQTHAFPGSVPATNQDGGHSKLPYCHPVCDWL